MRRSGDRSSLDKKQERKNRKEQRRLEKHGFEVITPPRKNIQPLQAKTEAQGQFIAGIIKNDIMFGLGPAGTGKTFVSTSLAAEALANGEIEKIIFTRPMVEAGEKMGHLPGGLDEKYAPWVQPLVSVLNTKLGVNDVEGKMKSQKIEALPLMFMRGRSLDNAWIILDEAQNTTPEQMKMFLTRIGENSKIIIDGDITQSDLVDFRGESIPNGLQDALDRLSGIGGIDKVEFTEEDIVRNPLIKTILQRYRH